VARRFHDYYYYYYYYCTNIYNVQINSEPEMHAADCQLSANRFANFRTGLILSLFWDKFILQRMIARVGAT